MAGSSTVQADLYRSAQRYAQRAAHAFHNGHTADGCADAGTALEQLLKACLIMEHPLLIVDSQSGRFNAEALRWAFAQGPLPGSLRTISGSEAWRRAKALVSGLDSIADLDIAWLLDRRGAALHLAHAVSEARDPLALLGDVAASVVTALGHDEPGFWGHWRGSVEARRENRRDQLRIIVNERRDAAAARFEDLLKVQPNAISALRGTLFDFGWNEEPTVCPACASTAIAIGEVDPEYNVDWEVGDGQVYASGAYVERTLFRAEQLRCPVCGFRLARPEEFGALQLPPSWEVERDWHAREAPEYGTDFLSE